MWDKFKCFGPCTVKGLISKLSSELKVKTSVITVGELSLFNSVIKSTTTDQRKNMLIEEAYEHVGGRIPEQVRSLRLEIGCTDSSGVSAYIPPIHYEIVRK